MNYELRSFVEPVEFRSKGTTLVASGVAMRYGAKSKPVNNQFREKFRPGSFTKTLKEQVIEAHNEHYGPYLGSTANGTLRLTDTPELLHYELDIPDTSAGRDTAVLLERGDIRGSSIGFNPIPSQVEWGRDSDGMALRSIREAKLIFVDLTMKPYYDESTSELALRSLADNIGLELRSVIEAAHDGRLADLIDPPTPNETSAPEDAEGDEQDEPDSSEQEDHGRETTVVRPLIAHLYL